MATRQAKSRKNQRAPSAQDLRTRLEELVTSPIIPRARRNTLPHVTHDDDPHHRDDPTPRDTPTTTTPRGLRRATRHANETIAHTTRPDDEDDTHENDERDDLAALNINDETPIERTRRRRNSDPNTTTTPTQPPLPTPKAKGKRKAKTAADKNPVDTATVAAEGATTVPPIAP